MSVTLNLPVRRLPFRGYDDPSLPSGIWWGAGSIVGDASGGTALIRFNFKTEAQPVSGDQWNVERVSAFSGPGTSGIGMTMIPVGLSPSRSFPGAEPLYRFALSGQGSGLNQSALGEDHPLMPVFLGATRGGADTLSAVGFTISNPTATDSFSVTAMGYIWEARSILANGGLNRPPHGLFGN